MSRSLDEQTREEKRDLVKQICLKKSGELDKDWYEISGDFNQNINADTLRKAGVGIKQAADAEMFGNASDDPSISLLSDGFVDRQKIRDLTNRVNRMYREESRSELMRETIREAIKSLPEIGEIHCSPRDSSSNPDKSLVLAIGDFHYGAYIHVEGLHGETLNHYDHTVFEERMARLQDETVEIINKEHVSQIYLFMVGDLIDGMLRQSQLMRLEYGVVESTIRLSEFLSRWIAELAKYSNVDVYASMGNHSEIRPLKSRNREFEDENLEKIVMWYLEARMKDIDNVYVDASCKRMTLVGVNRYNFLLIHGDGEKNINEIAKDTINLYGHSIDFFVCGHKHKEDEYPMGTTGSGNSIVVRTPSLCGMDRYAQSKGYGGNAGAIAIVMEEGYGRRCVYPIQLA